MMKNTPMNKGLLVHLKQITFLAAFVLIFAACSEPETTSHDGHDHDAEHGDVHDHDHGHDHAAEEVVVWPELTKLDGLSHKVIANHQAENFKANEEIAAEFTEAFEALLESEIPSNVKNSEQVKLVMADINSMQSIMSDFQRFQSDEVMSTTMDAIAVSVEKLVKESGIPHIHAKESADSHDDHDGHDHDDHEGHDH